MKVAIVGGGFAGLAAGVKLIENGVEVVVIEAEKSLGGLAGGFKGEGWEWNLEKFYHHIFDNDLAIKALAEKVGLAAVMYDPRTEVMVNGRKRQLDTALSVLKYDQMSLMGRLRMGLGLGVLKVIRNGKWLERFRAVKVLPVLLGKEGYERVWEPLLSAKFGSLVGKVNMAWFWARVAKRTKRLGYFGGGFGALAEKIGEHIKIRGGGISVDKQIGEIEIKDGKPFVDGVEYDGVLLTVPAPIANKLVGEEILSTLKIDYLWGQAMVLELRQSLMTGYWLNILEKHWPFLVVVEHTNLIDKSHYGGSEIVYLGNYLEEGDERLKEGDQKLVERYLPYLKKINKEFKKGWIKKSYRFQAPFAQPVFPVNYSKQIPKIQTKLPGVYVANMSMVYPWDRGTNYAVEIGERAAAEILKKLGKR